MSSNLQLLHPRLIPFFSKTVCHLFSTFFSVMFSVALFDIFEVMESWISPPPNGENMLLSWYPLSQGPAGLIQG